MKKKEAIMLASALVSGKFKQGTGKLRRSDNACCCLGVAEDIRGCKWIQDKQAWGVAGEYISYSSFLSDDGQHYYDFYTNLGHRRDGKPLIIKGNKYDCLADANDFGVSHYDIGVYIYENYRDL